MVPVYKKMEFLEFIKKNEIVTNKIACSFFDELYKDTKLLQRITFSKYNLGYMKYSIVINTSKKYIMCRINGKYYKSYRMLNYILRALMENHEMQIGICIICLRAPFAMQYEKVCHHIELVQDLLSSVVADSIIKDVQKASLLKSIDYALDNHDVELFMKLSAEYKILLT